MPSHNKGFCFMVLPRDMFSLSLCYLVVGSLEDAEVQPETSASHSLIVLHMFRPITMHFCRHIFNGEGKKAHVLLDPLRLVHFLFFHLSSCNFSPSGVFHWTFSLPFSIQSSLIEISQNQTQKRGEGGGSHSQQQFIFSTLFFLALFSLKGRGRL